MNVGRTRSAKRWCHCHGVHINAAELMTMTQPTSRNMLECHMAGENTTSAAPTSKRMICSA